MPTHEGDTLRRQPRISSYSHADFSLIVRERLRRQKVLSPLVIDELADITSVRLKGEQIQLLVGWWWICLGSSGLQGA
jgi:hypothetical protein